MDIKDGHAIIYFQKLEVPTFPFSSTVPRHALKIIINFVHKQGQAAMTAELNPYPTNLVAMAHRHQISVTVEGEEREMTGPPSPREREGEGGK